MVRIFVYGTLRRSGCRDMTRCYPEARFLSPATAKGTLYDLGEYPGLRLIGTDVVLGELFDVDDETLGLLDALEGCVPEAPELGEYVRTEIIVSRSNGNSEAAFVYEINEAFVQGCSTIPSGDWISHRPLNR